jgi:hypothetical protein
VLREKKNRENISLVLFFSTKSLLGVFGVWVYFYVLSFVIILFRDIVLPEFIRLCV